MARKKGRRKKSHAPKSHKKHGERRNPAKATRKGGKKRRRNPGMLGKIGGSGVTSLVKKGVGLALGIVGAKAVAQNVVPAAYRSGPVGAAAQAAVGLAAGWAMKKVSFLRPYAEGVQVGGVVAATQSLLEPVILPKLQLNLLSGLGETYYLGSLDRRVIAGPTGMGSLDTRVLVANGLAG